MKKFFIPFVALLLLASCTKNEQKDNPTPRSSAPAQLVGNWSYGSFSMNEFWSYNGSFQGNAFQLSVHFRLTNDGYYEKYTIAGSTTYGGCRTDNFAFEKGTVEYDLVAKTFTTYPTQAKYRFFSCTGNKEAEMPKSDLKVNTYKYNYQDGTASSKRLFIDPANSGANYTEFMYKNW